MFFLTQRLLPLLEAVGTADDPARVINIGSIDGIRSSAFETVSYAPSKAALHTLTRQLAAQLVTATPRAKRVPTALGQGTLEREVST